MARFLYIADTHLGADPMGYCLQPGCPERLRELLALLEEWIHAAGGVDFVLHGGDMVDAGTSTNIARAREAFRLSAPVYLCLGNHDLTDPNALRTWLSEAPDFFPGGRPEYSIQDGDLTVHVVPNHWCASAYCWEGEQTPRFSAEQMAFLEEGLARSPQAVHFLCAHSPVLGLPPEQTGFDEPHHEGGRDFAGSVFNLAHRFPQVRCVLGAHTHANMRVARDGVQYVTVSAFVETPFEFKLLEVERDVVKMTTLNLASKAAFRAEYDFGKTWVQGRRVDRAFDARRTQSK